LPVAVAEIGGTGHDAVRLDVPPVAAEVVAVPVRDVVVVSPAADEGGRASSTNHRFLKIVTRAPSGADLPSKTPSTTRVFNNRPEAVF
jgi:hypothetical protein